MGKLIYAINTSLDGYVADEHGNFDWSDPSEELHAFFNDLMRPIVTHLYGRRMYETMVYWETPPADSPPVERAFAELWQAAGKIVYSTTLEAVSSARTRLERNFDVDAVRELKASVERDISVSGPHLAAHAIRAGLVDEYHFVVAPVVIGGGNAALPDGIRLELELIEERRFDGGVVHLHYRTRQ